MSRVINDDDENCSSSSSTNSDDDMDELNCDTHRSCSQYSACNRNNHQHGSVSSMSTISLSKHSKPVRGDIQSIDNEPRHRQKYDGYKWRRLCSYPDCSKYLNGGVFHDNWLCREHYLLNLSSTVSNRIIAKNTESTTRKTSEKSSTRSSNKGIKHCKRGDMKIDGDGIRQKYNGKAWRPVCTYPNCKSFIVAHGYCRRHDLETRKKRSEILLSLDDLAPQTSISQSPIRHSIPKIVEKPKTGDVQLVRQRWNGNKWHSLCNHPTQDCTRRSAGLKCGNLCDIHYREYLEKQKNPTNLILLSPRMKRKKSTNYDSTNRIETQTSIPQESQSRIQHEQCIQTDLTCPLESNDLRQGCFLVDDDDDDSKDRYRCESPLLVYIKKEEDNSVNNKRKLSIDVHSLAMNCKLEVTKLEF